MSGIISIEFGPNELLERFDREHRLPRYVELLLQENQKINLVSRETSSEALLLMIAESLLPLTVLGREFPDYLDIGSGGGMPAIPLLISGQIGKATLVERTQKKGAALARLIKALTLPAKVIPGDFLSTKGISSLFDLVTLRYVAPDERMFKHIRGHLSESGVLVHYSSEPLPNPYFEPKTYRFVSGQEGVVKGFTVYQKK